MIRRLTIHFALAVAFDGIVLAADAAYMAKSREIRVLIKSRLFWSGHMCHYPFCDMLLLLK